MTSKQEGKYKTGHDLQPGSLGKAGNEPMKLAKLTLTILTFTTVVPLLIAGMFLRGGVQTTPSDRNSLIGSEDSTQVKIARAMSAGPIEVAKAATIVDTDAKGKMTCSARETTVLPACRGILKL